MCGIPTSSGSSARFTLTLCDGEKVVANRASHAEILAAASSFDGQMDIGETKVEALFSLKLCSVTLLYGIGAKCLSGLIMGLMLPNAQKPHTKLEMMSSTVA